jgi:hypothetical protein
MCEDSPLHSIAGNAREGLLLGEVALAVDVKLGPLLRERRKGSVSSHAIFAHRPLEEGELAVAVVVCLSEMPTTNSDGCGQYMRQGTLSREGDIRARLLIFDDIRGVRIVRHKEGVDPNVGAAAASAAVTAEDIATETCASATGRKRVEGRSTYHGR